jgi:hypothetical protein
MDTRLFPLMFAMSFFLMEVKEMEQLGISNQDMVNLTEVQLHINYSFFLILFLLEFCLVCLPCCGIASFLCVSGSGQKLTQLRNRLQLQLLT